MADPTMGLLLGGLQLGGSLIASKGQQDASAKQWRLQQMENARVEQINRDATQLSNEMGRYLGNALLATPEHESVHTIQNVNWAGFMDGAERSGFNPVTLLNAGGLSPYVDTQVIRNSFGMNAADAYKMMMPNYSLAQAATVPTQHSMLQGLGAGLSAAGSAFGTQYRADMSYDLQMEKMMLGLANQGMGLSQSNGLRTALNYGGGAANSTAGAGASKGLSDIPYPSQWKPGDVEVTNPFARNFIDSKYPNAETGEARYGEIGELLFGLRNITNDSVRNLTGRGLEDWGVAMGMNLGSYMQKGDTSWMPAVNRWWTSPTSAASTFGPSADSAWRTGWENLRSLGLVSR